MFGEIDVLGLYEEEGKKFLYEMGFQVEIVETKPPKYGNPVGKRRILRQQVLNTQKVRLVVAPEDYQVIKKEKPPGQ